MTRKLARIAIELVGFCLIAAGLWLLSPVAALGTVGAGLVIVANYADFGIRPGGGNSFPPPGPVTPPPLATATLAARPTPTPSARPWMRFAGRRQPGLGWSRFGLRLNRCLALTAPASATVSACAR